MRVVLLLGTSGAGKSTLCAQLKDKYKWEVAAADDFGDGLYAEAQTKAESVINDISSHDAISALLPDMTMAQMIHLAMHCELNLTQGEHSIKHAFVNEDAKPDRELTNLEQHLKEAGFEEHLIPVLASQLRKITKESAHLDLLRPDDLKEFFIQFLEHALNKSFEPDVTIILDVNPHAEVGVGPAEISNLIEQYCEQHPEQSIALFKVLAYCPLQELSRRVQDRIQSGYKGNMSEGIFSFEQLSQLMRARTEKDPSKPSKWHAMAGATLSRKDIFDVANQHGGHHTDIRSEPVVIVDTDDSLTSQSEVPIVAPKPIANAYHTLINKFGFQSQDDHIELDVVEDFQCDVVIDTSKQEAMTLADSLVAEIDGLMGARSATGIQNK